MNLKGILSRIIDAVLTFIRPSVDKIVGDMSVMLDRLAKLIELHERKIARTEFDLAASKQRARDYAVKEELTRAKIYDAKAARQSEVDRARRIKANVERLIG